MAWYYNGNRFPITFPGGYVQQMQVTAEPVEVTMWGDDTPAFIHGPVSYEITLRLHDEPTVRRLFAFLQATVAPEGRATLPTGMTRLITLDE